MAEVIGNCVHFKMRHETRELQCRVSNKALLALSSIRNDAITPDYLLEEFFSHRDRIERIAKEKFRRRDIWLGGVWVTLRDVTEDLLRADRRT